MDTSTVLDDVLAWDIYLSYVTEKIREAFSIVLSRLWFVTRLQQIPW